MNYCEGLINNSKIKGEGSEERSSVQIVTKILGLIKLRCALWEL